MAPFEIESSGAVTAQPLFAKFCSWRGFYTATRLLINNKTKMIDFFYHKKHVQALHKRIALLEQRISLRDRAISDLEKQNMRLLDYIFEIEDFWC